MAVMAATLGVAVHAVVGAADDLASAAWPMATARQRE
jgi:hypothetical protein